MGEPLQQEGKRPEPPVVAVLVPVVITMTMDQAEQYVADYGLDETDYEPGETLPSSVARSLATVRDPNEAVADALAGDAWLNDGMTVTVFGAEVIPLGEPFPGREGFVTGLCGHAVAGSEWRAGFRTCEHCHATEG